MENRTENPSAAQPPEAEQSPDAVEASRKRAFVEPSVSFPVDVLESTTFFQFTESGVTNP